MCYLISLLLHPPTHREIEKLKINFLAWKEVEKFYCLDEIKTEQKIILNVFVFHYGV